MNSASKTQTVLGVGPDGAESPGEKGTAAKPFRYHSREIKSAKGVVPLARTDLVFSAIQIVKEGGENNLHSHAGMDGLWFVLAGRVRFYGEGDEIIGEFGKHEGVLIPRGVAYWFESADLDEPLEILQVESFAKGEDNSRIDYAPRRAVSGDFEIFDAD